MSLAVYSVPLVSSVPLPWLLTSTSTTVMSYEQIQDTQRMATCTRQKEPADVSVDFGILCPLPWLIIPTSTVPMSKHSIAPYTQKMATCMSLKEPADVQPRDRPPCFHIFHTMSIVLFALLKGSSKSAEDHPVRPED